MSRPEDESSTELAWREIIENYGERAVLPDERTATDDDPAPDATTGDEVTESRTDQQHGSPSALPADRPSSLPSDLTGELPDRLLDDDEVEARQQAVAESERFRPPTPPPFPVPRTWQRGVAWAGIFVAPVLALVIALFSIYVNPLIGWMLVLWFVGGFVYLVLDMPRSPRDPWDDGSRV